MKNIKPAWLLAALVTLWPGTVASVQAADDAVAAEEKARDAFNARCLKWAEGKIKFNDNATNVDKKIIVIDEKKYGRFDKKFKSRDDFDEWLQAELFPDYVAELEKRQSRGEGPMDDETFNVWLTARVLEVINSKSLFELLSSGGVLMIPLILCSIVGVTFALLRAFEYRREMLFPPSFIEELKEKISDSVEAARAYCEETIAGNRHQAPAARMCDAGLKKAEGGRAAVEAAVENAGILEVDRLKRGLRVLQVVIAVAPLLGLVGTVYGMIGSFQSVEIAELGDDKAKMLSGGIYEALVTTATGLTIAIPLMIVYHFLNTRVDSLSEDFNGLALQFVEICPTNGGGTEAADLGDGAEQEDEEIPDEPEPAEPTVVA